MDLPVGAEKVKESKTDVDHVTGTVLRKEEKSAEGKPDSRTTWKNREKKLKFSYKEQKEYETIEEDIEELENKIAGIHEEMQAAASQYTRLAELSEEKEKIEQELSDKMERWVYLNDLAERIEQQSKMKS